jgi:peptide deformylase
MAVKKILTLGRYEKILRSHCEPVKKFNADMKQLAKDIRDTIDANPAIGLAAPQIGVLKRVFGVRLGYYDEQPDEEMKPPIIMVNPEILEQSEVMERGFDSCLSIPNMLGYSDRHLKIKLRYQDEMGKRFEREFEGWDARVIQHEYDHLDGVLFLDRLNTLEDLFVMVPDEDGKRRQVPYLEAVKQAEGEVDVKKPDMLEPTTGIPGALK